MQLREGETVGEYVVRLERRLQELEPPEGFTIQEWHIAQVYAFLSWPPDTEPELAAWRDLATAFRARFPEQTKKFVVYMGWDKKETV